jgi:hypothetical protein
MIHYVFPMASQSPYLWSRVSLIWSPEYPTLDMNAHKIINSTAPKSLASGLKQHLFGQSLHHTYHCILFGPPLFQLAILSHTRIILPLVYCTWLFKVFGFRFSYLQHNDMMYSYEVTKVTPRMLMTLAARRIREGSNLESQPSIMLMMHNMQHWSWFPIGPSFKI